MNNKRLAATLSIIVAGVVATCLPTFASKKEKDANAAAIGSKAPGFSLFDSVGAQHKLSDYSGKIVVLEWMNFDCPFVKKQYKTKSMQTLQQEYTKKGVIWFSVISSAPGKQGHYSSDDVNKISRERGSQATAVLLDSKGAVGRLYDAKTTPDMFVIDPKGTLVYSGAIDDKPSTDVEDVPTHNFVREALDAVLAGKPVATSYTKSYGCSVKY